MSNSELENISFDSAGYLDSLVHGNRGECISYIKNFFDSDPNIIPIYEEVIKSSLYEIGELWENNKITVATEHLATSITESLLNHIYDSVNFADRTGKRIAITTTENEFHRVGIKMVADVFEKNGWETSLLGANVPTQEIILFINQHKPDLFALSLSISTNLPNLERMVKEIRETNPDLPIIIGGQAFRHINQDKILKYENVFYISDLYSLELFIQNDFARLHKNE